MKLFKLAIPFWQHWLRFHSQHPEIESKSWIEQQEIISQNWFGFPHVWQHALEPLGYEVIEVLANVDIVQKNWAEENQISYREEFWSYDIAKAQVLKEQPDILFVADLFWFSYEWIQELRQACPSIKLVLGWYGAPIQDKSILKSFDLILSCIPELVEACHFQGLNSRHLNHSFDPKILEQLDCSKEPSIDFSFIGNIRRKLKFDSGREKILESLIGCTDIQIFSGAINAQDALPDLLKIFVKSNLYHIAKSLKQVGLPQSTLEKVPVVGKISKLESSPVRSVNPKLVPFLKPPVYGIEMFQTLCNSKTTLNSHIDASPRSASNMRMYEATGAGACLVTDHKENIRDLFEPDLEVVTYKSVEECIEKVTWLLENPTQRAAIARAGQARTLRSHTLEDRAVRLDNIIQEALRTCSVGQIS
jgi:spore maturation protein CgeB